MLYITSRLYFFIVAQIAKAAQPYFEYQWLGDFGKFMENIVCYLMGQIFVCICMCVCVCACMCVCVWVQQYNFMGEHRLQCDTETYGEMKHTSII